jgi:hypothetical protein
MRAAVQRQRISTPRGSFRRGMPRDLSPALQRRSPDESKCGSSDPRGPVALSRWSAWHRLVAPQGWLDNLRSGDHVTIQRGDTGDGRITCQALAADPHRSAPQLRGHPHDLRGLLRPRQNHPRLERPVRDSSDRRRRRRPSKAPPTCRWKANLAPSKTTSIDRNAAVSDLASSGMASRFRRVFRLRRRREPSVTDQFRVR